MWFAGVVAQCARAQQPPKYGAQMLACLIAADLERARLLWRRVPADTQAKNVELKAVRARARAWRTAVRSDRRAQFWAVALALMGGDRPAAFARLGNQRWSTLHAPLVTWLVDALRARALALLARAYADVALATAAAALGLAESEAASVLVERGWTRDDATFRAPPSAGVARRELAHAKAVGAELVGQLAEQVLFVEQQSSRS